MTDTSPAGPPDPDAEFDELRQAILAAALPNVPFDGWTMAALKTATSDAGYAPDEALRAFPGGPREAVEAYLQMADARMLESLAAVDVDSLKIRERIAKAVRTRLENAAAERDVVRRTLSLLATPAYARVSARSLYRTVDAIWYWAGDTATDFNFYTKRGLLAGVYFSTLLYWLDDESPNSDETWAFLDRRIADVMRIPKLTGRLRALANGLPSPLRAMRRCRPGQASG